jgi:hypothetical protein
VKVPVPPFAQPAGKAYPEPSRLNREKTLPNCEVLISLALAPVHPFDDHFNLW